eukprot:jgi/Bigna1/128458/aug1.6_g3166
MVEGWRGGGKHRRSGLFSSKREGDGGPGKEKKPWHLRISPHRRRKCLFQCAKVVSDVSNYSMEFMYILGFEGEGSEYHRLPAPQGNLTFLLTTGKGDPAPKESFLKTNERVEADTVKTKDTLPETTTPIILILGTKWPGRIAKLSRGMARSTTAMAMTAIQHLTIGKEATSVGFVTVQQPCQLIINSYEKKGHHHHPLLFLLVVESIIYHRSLELKAQVEHQQQRQHMQEINSTMGWYCEHVRMYQSNYRRHFEREIPLVMWSDYKRGNLFVKLLKSRQISPFYLPSPEHPQQQERLHYNNGSAFYPPPIPHTNVTLFLLKSTSSHLRYGYGIPGFPCEGQLFNHIPGEEHIGVKDKLVVALREYQERLDAITPTQQQQQQQGGKDDFQSNQDGDHCFPPHGFVLFMML